MSAAKVDEGEAIVLTVVVQHAADVQQIGIAPPEAAGMTVAFSRVQSKVSLVHSFVNDGTTA